MKNFFKRPQKTKQSNILIDYTKWLLKISALVLLFILIVFFISIYYGKYKSSEVTMIVLECKVIEDNQAKLKANHWQSVSIGFESIIKITRARNQKDPLHMYSASRNFFDDKKQKLSPTFRNVVFLTSRFMDATGYKEGDKSNYFFKLVSNEIDDNTYIVINRKTLERKDFYLYDTPTPVFVRECHEVSENKFNDDLRSMQDKIKKDYKF